MSENQSLTYRSDPDLIQACLNGDAAAWKELVERYARLVYSIPLRLGLSADDADDVFQNVFTIVFRQLHSLRNHNVLAAWLITITHRESLHLRKLLAPYAKSYEFSATIDALPPDQVETWERQHLVRQAMSQLDPESQKLLTALFLDPSAPTYKEIAARLGIPEGSIGPLRARCFKKLEAVLVAMGIDLSP